MSDSFFKKHQPWLGYIVSEEPFQAKFYNMEGNQLLDNVKMEEFHPDKMFLVFNFSTQDEIVFLKHSFKTVSVQTLFSIAGRCPLDLYDMDDIFKKTAHIYFTGIFCNKKTDFTNLFSIHGFWKRIAGLVYECLGLIQKHYLTGLLELEVQVCPVLHSMFDYGYPVDVKKAMSEYNQLKDMYEKVAKQVRKDCFICSDIYRTDMNGKENSLLAMEQLCKKLEDKIRRFPNSILQCKEETAFLTSQFRSIGTKTYRITTHHTNIQGMPSVLRRCLLPRQKNNMLVEYDIASSQLYILACLSGEKELVSLYKNGQDLYMVITSRICGRHEREITAEERSFYKKWILQMLYGAGINSLQLEIESFEYKESCMKARDIKARFYAVYPSVKHYCDKVRGDGFITSPDGNRWDLRGCEPYKRLTFLMQSVEGMLLRQALIFLDQAMKNEDMSLYACIHDSVLLETGMSCYGRMRGIVSRCFNKAAYKTLKNNNIKIQEEIIYDMRSIRKSFERS